MHDRRLHPTVIRLSRALNGLCPVRVVSPGLCGYPDIDWRRGGERAAMVPGSLGRTWSSWLREVMSSLLKTLLRWYLTVRALMNSRAPISGLESPSRASLAIWASWAVSWTPVSRCVCGRSRRRPPVRGGPRRTPRCPSPAACRGRCAAAPAHHCGGARVVAIRRRADEPGPAATNAAVAQARDRLAVEALGGLALAEQSTMRASIPSAQSVGVTAARRTATPGRS